MRPGGLLLVGAAEAVSSNDGRFEVVSKPERLYRRIGGSRPSDLALMSNPGDGPRARVRPGLPSTPSRQRTLADLCVKHVVETYGPAAVLVNARLEVPALPGADGSLSQGGVGTTDVRHRRPGARGGANQIAGRPARGATERRTRRRDRRADQRRKRLAVVQRRGDASVQRGGAAAARLLSRGAAAGARRARGRAVRRASQGRRTRTRSRSDEADLQKALRNLEASSEEQMAINEEALSVNEEYQSTNEELLTSKEELQSLNEELTALNSQLQETLGAPAHDLPRSFRTCSTAPSRRRSFSTPSFSIRFFTPATKAFFNVIPERYRPAAGRPEFAGRRRRYAARRPQRVAEDHAPVEREIEGRRRVVHPPDPALSHARQADRRRRRHLRGHHRAQESRRGAGGGQGAGGIWPAWPNRAFSPPPATIFASRCRPWLCCRACWPSRVEGEKAAKLVDRLDEALSAMTEMLNTLLNINQIEVGDGPRPSRSTFRSTICSTGCATNSPIMPRRQGLCLRVARCGLSIRSDPRLLEQMIRNLLANALKYTKRGRVLFGCRRRADACSIEIWDTGVGIADVRTRAVFDEYYQVDNAARQRKQGLGLGLSIVKSLGALLDHPIHVRSLPGKGSVFSIIKCRRRPRRRPHAVPSGRAEAVPEAAPASRGTVLIVDDDVEVRDHLELFLQDEGYLAATASDGATALKWAENAVEPPDLVLADYNLPNGMNGVEVAQRLRHELDRQIPFIVLTGDIDDRGAAQHRHPRLRVVQQAGEAARVDARHREVARKPPSPAIDDQEPAGGAPPRLAPARRSSSSTTTIGFAARSAPCWKMTDAPSRPMRAAKRFSLAYDPGKPALL